VPADNPADKSNGTKDKTAEPVAAK